MEKNLQSIFRSLVDGHSMKDKYISIIHNWFFVLDKS